MKTFASLFSGGGGADIGAAMAQFQPIWAIENDPDIAGVYAANLGHQAIVKSVDEVNPNSLERPDVLWHRHLVKNGVLPEARAYPKDMMLTSGILLFRS